MIHYSIIPIEQVFKSDTLSIDDSIKLIDYKGCKVEVSTANGVSKICRVISTSPKDFLSNELQPGTIINNNY